MDKLKASLCSLEERLVEHDENREVVQSVLKEICSDMNEGADSLEEKINGDTHVDFKRRRKTGWVQCKANNRYFETRTHTKNGIYQKVSQMSLNKHFIL